MKKTKLKKIRIIVISFIVLFFLYAAAKYNHRKIIKLNSRGGRADTEFFSIINGYRWNAKEAEKINKKILKAYRAQTKEEEILEKKYKKVLEQKYAPVGILLVIGLFLGLLFLFWGVIISKKGKKVAGEYEDLQNERDRSNKIYKQSVKIESEYKTKMDDLEYQKTLFDEKEQDRNKKYENWLLAKAMQADENATVKEQNQKLKNAFAKACEEVEEMKVFVRRIKDPKKVSKILYKIDKYVDEIKKEANNG